MRLESLHDGLRTCRFSLGAQRSALVALVTLGCLVGSLFRGGRDAERQAAMATKDLRGKGVGDTTIWI